MVDSFKGQKSGERSLESQDSCRGIGNSLEELLFSFERPGNRGSIFEVRGSNGNLNGNSELRRSVKMETQQIISRSKMS